MLGGRIVAWAGASGVLAITDGLGFMGQPVEVPLWAFLMVAFLPLGELVDLVRHRVDGLEPRGSADGAQ